MTRVTHRFFAPSLLVVLSFFATRLLFADDPVIQAQQFIAQGNAIAAADLLAQFVQSHPAKDKVRGRALLLLGRALEQSLEGFNTDAEQQCFRRGRGGAPCMHRYADALNAKYGPGVFAYTAEIVVLRYTGSHYREVMEGWSDPDLLAEASYRVLEKNLIGKLDEVLPRVQEFLQKYPKGEWGRKGRLLWARLNEDVWWIHRNWAWLLYNWNYSEDELIIRAEKYRKGALRVYEELIKKDGGSEEGKLAKREYEALKANKSDGIMYGIINESMVGQAKGK